MELSENKSQIWYLVLNEDLSSLDHAEDNWKRYLPQEEKKGEWKKSQGNQAVHLMSNPTEQYREGRRVFVVEIKGEPIKEKPGEIWMQELRLVREATVLDIKELGLYFGQVQ